MRPQKLAPKNASKEFEVVVNEPEASITYVTVGKGCFSMVYGRIQDGLRNKRKSNRTKTQAL